MKPKLIISKNLSSRINYLHNSIGDTEWSGALIFSIEEGSIAEPSKMVLLTRDIYLMDIGTSVYTEYEMGNEITKIYEKYPKADLFKAADSGEKPWKIGQIHTHHNMSSFFSGTDLSDLRNNAPNHTFYLSLIVNFKCDYVAKIGINCSVEEEKKYSWGDGLGNKITFPSTTKIEKVIDLDCEIVFEDTEDLSERISELKSKKVVKNLNIDFNKTKNIFEDNSTNYRNKLKHISKNQQEAFNKREFVSNKAVEKYLINLLSCGSNKKPKSIKEAVDSISSENESEVVLWEEMVFDNIEIIFDETFDSTTLSVNDISEKCCDLLEDYLYQHSEDGKYNAADYLYSMFCEIYGQSYS